MRMRKSAREKDGWREGGREVTGRPGIVNVEERMERLERNSYV